MAKLADKMYLKRLLETPSVTGMESLVASLVRERLAECADVIETDVMGSVHARLLGNGSAPSVMIAAHMDGKKHRLPGFSSRCSRWGC